MRFTQKPNSRRPFAPFLEIFSRYHEQAEGFAVLFGLFGMVGAVRSQDGPAVGAVQLAEPLKALVDIHVVYEEVDQPVNRNADAHEQETQVRRCRADDVASRAGNGENEEEQVVALEEAAFVMVRLVVIGVPRPQKAVHDVLVREPRHEFHAGHCGQGDEYVSCYLHCYLVYEKM